MIEKALADILDLHDRLVDEAVTEARRIAFLSAGDRLTRGREEGAAVLGGLLGMALAIQAREAPRRRREDDEAFERAMAKVNYDGPTWGAEGGQEIE